MAFQMLQLTNKAIKGLGTECQETASLPPLHPAPPRATRAPACSY